METCQRPLLAVAAGQDGLLGPLCGEGVLDIWGRRGPGRWEKERQVSFHLGGEGGPGQRDSGTTGTEAMRLRLKELCRLLGGVRAVLARSVPGLAHHAMRQEGLALMTLESFEPGSLEELWQALEEALEPETQAPCAPFETESGSGVFLFDLKAALSSYPEATSKKLLRPFLEAGGFRELGLSLDHLPPWLPQELAQKGYAFRQVKSGAGDIFMKIFPQEGKLCS